VRAVVVAPVVAVAFALVIGGAAREVAAGPAGANPAAPGTPPPPSPTTAPATTSAAPSTTPPGAPAPASQAAASRRSHDALLDALGTDDLPDLERAVAAIMQLPASESDPDVVFAAGRACEDKLGDPGRAVAIYDRIVAEHPTARVATAATRRATALREQIGPHGETAALAAELAQLIAHADAQPAGAVIQRAERLATAAWPGAPAAALWLADWLRRSGQLAEAQAHYAVVAARWPASPEARAALRGGAGCALDAHDWALAETLANRLPLADPVDRIAREDLLAAAARGRRRDRWYAAAWIAIAGAFASLLGSLAEAVLRSPAGTRWAALRPPIEVVFLAPVALVLVGVAFTAHRLIAPAVVTISAGGIALTWLSGATLERLRARGRRRRLRSVVHVLACLAGVAALAYVALTHGGLIELLIETVRFGPET
jgi:tetratricopeptide (TPR) repeat protein